MTNTPAEYQIEINAIVLEISQTPHSGVCKLLDFLYRNPTVATLECFLDQGINFMATPTNGRYPLWCNLIDDSYNPQLLERLLKLDVDVNQSFSSSYESPLLLAAKCNSPKFCELLLDHGARISDYNGEGWQPIHRAAFANRDSTLNFLISRGANVNAVNQVGVTPMHLNAEQIRVDGGCRSQVLDSLVRAGANVNAIDTSGRNVIYSALRIGNIRILFDLVACGTKFQIFGAHGRGFWDDLRLKVLSTNDIDHISVLYYMSGELIDWKPARPNYECTETRFWNNCTTGCLDPAFAKYCNQVIRRHTDEIVTTCVGLQSLELPSLVLCEIIFEVLACWRRLNFCEIWDRVVAVRHFHERYFKKQKQQQKSHFLLLAGKEYEPI